MLIIGCDFHSRFQQIAVLDSETGKVRERRLDHEIGAEYGSARLTSALYLSRRASLCAILRASSVPSSLG